LIGFLVVILIAWSGHAQTPAAVEPLASLPLDEVLRLYRENEEAKEAEPEAPPIAASVDSIEVRGQLLDQAVDMRASVVVSVLENEKWVVVPLFSGVGKMNLVELPQLDGGMLTILEDDLVLIVQRRGIYRFELLFNLTATTKGLEREVALDVADATVALLRIGYDGSVFRLRSPATRVQGDESVLFPISNRFSLAWERRERVDEKQVSAEVAAPPIEPAITRAFASVVSTLEGERVVRMLLELRMQGTQKLRCRLGEKQTLKRVILNGSAVPFEVVDGWLEIEVAPSVSGRSAGSLELLLNGETSAYHLAGELDFGFPVISWPVHELFVSLHLPDVFNYVWTSGSLEPIESAPTASFSHTIPLPGKSMSFHQFLVASSSPRLNLAYTVDLEGQYFRP
jgi:hypothetical protein